MKKYLLSALVNNHFGVLTRISGLFSRRGYNIKSLTVGETENPDISRMTIEVVGDEHTVSQIRKQLSKVVDVRDVIVLDDPVSRELYLVKVKADDTNREALKGVAEIYKAKIVDVCPECLIFEVTGEESKLRSFFDMMKTYGIIEIARTGVTALERGL
ncbi:MAG: acetolactate synthase small subunit [Clostridiales bacterium]|nr:acetolactate synthase small subunit [Candidatus Coliplasma equi]